MNYKQVKAIEVRNKARLKEAFPDIDILDESGIYVLKRTDEIGLKYVYVGQSVKVLTRLAQHLVGYAQHIDLSLRKHKFKTKENPCGWYLDSVTYCNGEFLDELEKSYIWKFANEGYQLYNKTGGGQGEGKVGIAPNKPSKGYYDGVKQGRENARKEIAKLFDKYLVAEIAGKPNKIKERALQKFANFLSGEDQKEQGDG